MSLKCQKLKWSRNVNYEKNVVDLLSTLTTKFTDELERESLPNGARFLFISPLSSDNFLLKAVNVISNFAPSQLTFQNLLGSAYCNSRDTFSSFLAIGRKLSTSNAPGD